MKLLKPVDCEKCMIDLLLRRLKNSFKLTLELFDSLDEHHLVLELKDLPSNTIGKQVWCIIGARESYFMALQLGNWNGFSCSLNDSENKSQVLEKLDLTARKILSFLKESKNLGLKEDFIFDLLEHEVQHHGQLIRFMYGNKLEFPESWKERYTV